ncbi:FAD-dependent oxidoreductase [Actinomadura rubrisoli]|uniref:FAD-dependent oxidoreductase n=1 Tax=Actinomadura rubrisoli TaxID=2530368 RepID=A0A4V2YW89_9ACTN|nr:FAD-dependent oxidoreductase [Actinomadura rubrisoli]TDD84487.1 FAD-dependent oxidoreductase [Actinomadura rubrisoli]
MSRPTAAVVGSGIAGMTSAYLLQRRYDVTVFEANGYLGGNADTQDAVLPDGTRSAVDVAFMAYGDTYPNLKRLLSELHVESKPASIQHDLVCAGCGFTHLGSTPFGDGVIPGKPDGVEPAVWERFVSELERFSADLAEASEAASSASIASFLADHGYSDYFFQHFIYPRVGPWWLNGPDSVRAMSLEFLLSTAHKHALLKPDAFATWKVTAGGSRTYLTKIAEGLSEVLPANRVREVRRVSDGVVIRDTSDVIRPFDRAVLAVHPPTLLELLSDATPRERELLGVFGYRPMEVTLHTDLSVFPETGRPHSGFSMRLDCRNPDPRLRGFDIDASIVQRIDSPTPLIVSYNGADEVAPAHHLTRSTYEHPVNTPEVFEAQKSLPDLNDDRLAFAGAWFGSGLHEDGCASGAAAAEALGAPWD